MSNTCPHCLRASDSLLDADADSLSAARLLWLAMRAAVLDGKNDFPLSYFVGFSHALNLCTILSLDEWLHVQHIAGNLAAMQGLN